jgi:hypothetical protein
MWRSLLSVCVTFWERDYRSIAGVGQASGLPGSRRHEMATPPLTSTAAAFW